MNGKFVLCFAVVLVAQARSASVLDGEELKKMGEQFVSSALSVTGHLNALIGIPYTTSEAQKNYDRVKAYVSKGAADLETELGKLKESVRKSADPKVADKIDELEKEIKKQTTEAKSFFDEKVGKPINEKYKDDVKKFSDSVLKATKDIEAALNKAIDYVKKP